MDKVIIKKYRSPFSKLLLSFVQRFHLLLFFILVVSFLAASVIMINKTLTDSSSQDYTSTIDAGTIDRSTLERIQSLHTSDQPGDPQLPSSGRINPFAE